MRELFSFVQFLFSFWLEIRAGVYIGNVGGIQKKRHISAAQGSITYDEFLISRAIFISSLPLDVGSFSVNWTAARM